MVRWYIPVVHNSDRYEFVKNIGWTNYGTAGLMKDKQTNDLVTVKYIERGARIDANVEREIINHRSLSHPNILSFKEVILTPSHLGIVMEYASGGSLSDIVHHGVHLHEEKARHYFQQLISGISYCHSMQVSHRDLTVNTILLDGSEVPRLKISDFSHSKSSVPNSQPNSCIGLSPFIAPEAITITEEEYDGEIADVWSCGVILYAMLVGVYPFSEPRNFLFSALRILKAEYSFPDDVPISEESRDLISRIFVLDPVQRITMADIKRHTWFLKNLPNDLKDEEIETQQLEEPMQSLEVIMRRISEAKTTVPGYTDRTSKDPFTHSTTEN